MSNANNNNRNNNNNNNDNNDNGNDFNINSNNNAANNNNAIMIPVGKRKRRSLRTRAPGKFFSKKTSALKSVLRNHRQFLMSLDLNSGLHREALDRYTGVLLRSLQTDDECSLA